jgi:hypothetical protein
VGECINLTWITNVQIPTKTEELQANLRDWNKNVFGNIFQAQRTLEQCLEEIQQESILQGHSDALRQEEELLRQQLEERHKQEEILWKHKSRVQWLKEGENNTNSFHYSMVHRRYINHITKLEDE